MNQKSTIKNSKKLFIFLACLGIALIAVGIFTASFTDNDKLSGRLVGFGSGFGSGIAGVAFVGLIRLRKDPTLTQQQEINEKDERLIKIREKSAMSTWYITLIGLVVVAFTFLILDYLLPCFIIIGLMAVHVVSYFVFLYKNSKEL